jgi:hypothetical protein
MHGACLGKTIPVFILKFAARNSRQPTRWPLGDIHFVAKNALNGGCPPRRRRSAAGSALLINGLVVTGSK